jgi:hypothetical protein
MTPKMPKSSPNKANRARIDFRADSPRGERLLLPAQGKVTQSNGKYDRAYSEKKIVN